MKKLLEKDKKLRFDIKALEQQKFVLRSIFKNFNFSLLIRWMAFVKLKFITKSKSRIALTNRCLNGINKKRFNKLTTFSRQIFLKIVRSGLVTGLQKATW